jgi:hypothetical protein
MVDDEIRRKVEKHDDDLYRGNGKPGLTVRVALNEQEIATVKETVDEIKSDSKAMKRMLIGLILTILGEIAVRLVTGK